MSPKYGRYEKEHRITGRISRNKNIEGWRCSKPDEKQVL